MSRTRRRFIAIATEAAHSSDPSASGAGYLWTPADVIPELMDNKAPLDTNAFTGNNWDTAPEEGPDGWALSGVEWPLIGLPSAAGSGVNASTIADDWKDLIFTHLYGVQETTVGAAITAVASATGITVTGGPYALHDVFPLFEAGVPAREHTQWNVITADGGGGVYTVAPGFLDFATAPPTAAAIAYGVKRYIWNDAGGATMAFVYRDHTQDYTLLGGRCTSAQIRIPSGGGRAKLVTSWRGDRKIAESKASLPVPGAAAANATIRGVRTPIFFDGTRYDSMETTIDFGISAVEIMSTYGTEGRVGDEHVAQRPIITMRPRFQNAIENLKRNATRGRLLVQIGGARLAGGALNGQAIHVDQAVAKVVTRQDDSGVKRQEVQFFAHDPGEVGGAATRIWQHLRC